MHLFIIVEKIQLFAKEKLKKKSNFAININYLLEITKSVALTIFTNGQLATEKCMTAEIYIVRYIINLR